MKNCLVCREPVQDDAEKCPHCGTWIVFKEAYFKSFDYLLWQGIRSIKGMMIFFTVLLILQIFASFLILAATK